MKVFSNALCAFIISSMIIGTYPQFMCINNIKMVDNSIRIEAKIVDKDLKYFKQEVRFPVLVDGKQEKNIKYIKYINSVFYKDILSSAENAEKVSRDEFEYLKGENVRFPYEVKSDFKITSDNNKFISLYNDYYEFLGGAHGITVRTSYMIDKEKEKLVNLGEIFKQGYNYKPVIDKKIKDKIEESPQNYFYDPKTFKGIDEKQGFYISNDMLIIYYQIYDIAPYVGGIPEFEIPLELFEDNYIYK